jgi:putative addiction module component (TIGR02574 family)
MSMTLEQIVQETKSWPPEQVGELVGRLTEDLHTSSPEIEALWKLETDRRIEEIESGKVKGIPLEESLAHARKIAGL